MEENKKQKSWKSLFINDENSEENTSNDTTTKKAETKKESGTKFPVSFPTESNDNAFGFSKSSPTSNTSFATSSSGVSQEHLDKFMDIYEGKFRELNQEGYDFFEFFQSVIHGDINNSLTYSMAFGMGAGMDATISKEKLLSQSEFYIQKLNEVYEKYISDGNNKKQGLVQERQTKNQSLTTELNSLKEQLEAVKFQIQDKEKKLSLIDNEFEPQITEVDKKLTANEVAKNAILSKIEKVKQGINNNLK